MSGPLDVLVVDDEPKICDLLEQVLTSRGCSVRSASNGLEALVRFKERPAEVVITDIQMPKLDGLELIRELKRQDPLLNIVVITGYPSIDGAVDAMRCGACDFITKPFDVIQIQAILYRCHQRLTLNRQLRHLDEGSSKLNELNRRLADLNDLKSQFLAALSHEVNTPLCLMSEWIYLLSDGTLGKLSNEQQEAVDALINAYDRLHRLLRQLTDLMHGSELVLQRQQSEVSDLIRQAVDGVMPRASMRSITLTCHVPKESMLIDIDRVRTISAIEHLLDNAIKFNRDNGRVDVEVITEKDTIQVRVRDSGIGIAPEEMQKVLVPFYQVDRRTKGACEGAGVGLTLAKRYIELHGGTLNLASDPGKGTTVTISLPRSALAVTLPPKMEPHAL